jgi:hypothetical protein
MTGKAGSGSEILPTYISGLPPLFKRPWRVTGHHVKNGPGASKDDRRMVPLVDYLHMLTHEIPGQFCIERGKKLFEEFWGVDLEAEIRKLNARYEAERRAA